MDKSNPPERFSLTSSKLWTWVLVGYTTLLLLATHKPSNGVSPSHSYFDKLIHLCAFGVLAVLVAVVLRLRSGRTTIWQLLAIAAGVAMFGALDELTQIPVGRTCDILDWAADVAGATLGLLSFKTLLTWRDARLAGSSD